MMVINFILYFASCVLFYAAASKDLMSLKPNKTKVIGILCFVVLISFFYTFDGLQ